VVIAVLSLGLSLSRNICGEGVRFAGFRAIFLSTFFLDGLCPRAKRMIGGARGKIYQKARRGGNITFPARDK
jgi:hypothetical protein